MITKTPPRRAFWAAWWRHTGSRARYVWRLWTFRCPGCPCGFGQHKFSCYRPGWKDRPRSVRYYRRSEGW